MGSPHCPTCVYRIPTCVELSQCMHRPVRIMEELCRLPTYLDLDPHQESDPDLRQRQRRLHLRKGNSHHSWGSLPLWPNKLPHDSIQLVTALECLAGTPPNLFQRRLTEVALWARQEASFWVPYVTVSNSN
ncbi:hypothetical protein PIB30_021895 [Stylosanthes scabra]|uniref:Uncharacterized protein n=1 Tax=Stylosanthes scabra TaxID=79078 RepID=A0ABU6S9Q5_9FABA|nr:hypothetical protein [Stylosanthes scabra]